MKYLIVLGKSKTANKVLYYIGCTIAIVVFFLATMRVVDFFLP